MSRCPRSRLTKLQAYAMTSQCLNEEDARVPWGVYRSLVIRGLITPEHHVTPLGYHALERCMLLSEKFRQVVIAAKKNPRRQG